MISLNPVPSPRIAEMTDLFFEPGGLLEQHCATGGINFELRPQQQRMARAVAEANTAEHHLAVEAGTGVGKSFAYLVPQILSALENGTRAVIATYTITLQEQLMYKDIPFVRKALGRDFKAVLVKGRSNYICLRRLYHARQTAADLFDSTKSAQIEKLKVWVESQRAKDGSFQEMDEIPDFEVRQAVCSEQHTCLGKKCRLAKRCFFQRARQEMYNAQILVVNHHLFFSALTLQSSGVTLLPPFSSVVFDEAHQMEQVASSLLGLRLSPYMIDSWLRRLYTQDKHKPRGLLTLMKDGEGALTVSKTWDAAVKFFQRIREFYTLGPEKTRQRAFNPPDMETPLPEYIAALCRRLKELTENTDDENLLAELSSAREHGYELRDMVEAFLYQSLEGHVYWTELEGRRRPQPVLYSAPICIAPILREMLFEKFSCVIMTSATLAVGGNLAYFRSRIGAESCTELRVGSPFDYARQMRICIPANLPPPTADNFEELASEAISYFVKENRGRAFVLFTNARFMKKTADRLQFDFEQEGYKFLVQGAGTPPKRMIEEFKNHEAAVLFGLDRFWMGVDVPGEALSCVIITRLPFAVPEHPLIQARFEEIRERGGNPFLEYSLPEAVLKFRQGAGRLIRSESDTGTIVILDSRVTNQGYGKLFIQSMPECPVDVVEIPNLGDR